MPNITQKKRGGGRSAPAKLQTNKGASNRSGITAKARAKRASAREQLVAIAEKEKIARTAENKLHHWRDVWNQKTSQQKKNWENQYKKAKALTKEREEEERRAKFKAQRNKHNAFDPRLVTGPTKTRPSTKGTSSPPKCDPSQKPSNSSSCAMMGGSTRRRKRS